MKIEENQKLYKHMERGGSHLRYQRLSAPVPPHVQSDGMVRDKDFKVNIEVNHATLAGHTFEHELAVAVDNGMLGSIDANRGDSVSYTHLQRKRERLPAGCII